MKNLHSIQDDIPLWVRQMVLIWNFDGTITPWIYDRNNQTAYPKTHKSFVLEHTYDYDFWINKNRWKDYIMRADLSKFDNKYITII